MSAKDILKKFDEKFGKGNGGVLYQCRQCGDIFFSDQNVEDFYERYDQDWGATKEPKESGIPLCEDCYEIFLKKVADRAKSN